MHFAHPVFLLVALVAALALIALYVHLAASRRRALALLGASRLLRGLTASVSPTRRRLKEALTVAGVVLLAVALARPQLGYRFEEAHRRGVDVLFAVDTSKSMLTADVKPNRLERAKLAVRDLVEKFPDDRVGLVAFAGSAFLETPLTLDHAIFEQSLDGLDTNVIPLGGTNVAAALDVAGEALADDAHKKVLVLLTDGEDLSGEALAAAEKAAKEGMVVYTVGVGTPSGELVPLASNGGQTSFVKDEQGHFVTSRLDETLLRRIAATTGGSYRALGDNGSGLESLYTDELSTLPRSDLAARSQRVPIERFQWPLGLGLLLLSIEPLVSERRRARKPSALPKVAARLPVGARLAAASAAGLTLCLVAATASASPQSAERAYGAGQFAKAQTEYAGSAKAKPGDPELDFNLGAAAYRNGDLDAATNAFEGALHTDDLALQEKGYFNLGDVLYRTGQRTLTAGKKDDTIAAWKQAVTDYEAALHLQAADADAKFNRDFVKARIAELEKQQQDDKPKEPPKDDKQGKDDKSGSKDKSGGHGSKDQKSSNAGSQRPNTGSDAKGNGSDSNGKSSSGPSSTRPNPATSGTQPPPSAGGAPAAGTDGAPRDAKGTPRDKNGPSPAPDAREGAGAELEGPSGPGELSKTEARALLDSLRGELQVKPRTPTPATPSADQPQKDW